MKIGVIGGGEVAKHIADNFLELGHEVMLGVHDPGNHKTRKKGGGMQIGTTTEAASFAELAILASAWRADEDILQQVRPSLAGKIVIDVTTPLEFNDDGPPQLAIGHDISGGEMVQQSLPDSHVVKTLNFVSHRKMLKPQYTEGTPIMFICGNNVSARLHVTELLDQMGWKRVVDIGGIEKSRLLEPLCALWIEYGLASDTWNHAFSVLNK